MQFIWTEVSADKVCHVHRTLLHDSLCRKIFENLLWNSHFPCNKSLSKTASHNLNRCSFPVHCMNLYKPLIVLNHRSVSHNLTNHSNLTKFLRIYMIVKIASFHNFLTQKILSLPNQYLQKNSKTSHFYWF